MGNVDVRGYPRILFQMLPHLPLPRNHNALVIARPDHRCRLKKAPLRSGEVAMFSAYIYGNIPSRLHHPIHLPHLPSLPQ